MVKVCSITKLSGFLMVSEMELGQKAETRPPKIDIPYIHQTGQFG